MKYLECMIAWTPQSWVESRPATAGQAKIGPWPDESGWSDAYAMTGGACYTRLHKMEKAEQEMMLFVEFNTMVVRDRIDPQVAHEAFLAIDEYRRRISPDIKGADLD